LVFFGIHNLLPSVVSTHVSAVARRGKKYSEGVSRSVSSAESTHLGGVRFKRARKKYGLSA